ncbi:MAG: hypothetical protein M1469_09240 [Bacteroidetes bacterium]|nr:hypothetical protein [Bacteroidota bacterium]
MYIRRSNALAWSKRNRRIAALVKSGKTLREVANEISISREGVRKLMLEMGITTAYRAAANRRRRNLSTTELRKIKRLFQDRMPIPVIAEKLELDIPYLSKAIAEHGLKRKIRCAICGVQFEVSRNYATMKYCVTCSVERMRQRNAQFQREHYRTDPEFKRKKTEINNSWKRSAAGKKWFAEHRKKLKGAS